MKRIIFLCTFIILAFVTTVAQEGNIGSSYDSYANDTIFTTQKHSRGFMYETLKNLRKEIPILVEDIEKRKKDLQNDPDDVYLADFIQAQENKLMAIQKKLYLFSQLKGFDLNGKKIKLEQNNEYE